MLGISKQTFGDWRRAMKIPVSANPPSGEGKAGRTGPAPAVQASRESGIAGPGPGCAGPPGSPAQ